MAMVPIRQVNAVGSDGSPLIVGAAQSAPVNMEQVKIPAGIRKKLIRRTHDGARPYGMTWGPPVEYVKVPSGEMGTVATLKIMKELVLGQWGHRNPEVVLLAKKIAAGVSGGANKNYRAMAQSLLDFMHEHFEYQLDPAGLEYLQTPHYTLLVGGTGDCDDSSTALAALAMALGFRAGFRTVKGDPGRKAQWSHVYAVIGIQERGETVWLTADGTQKESFLGWDPPQGKLFGMKTWIIDPSIQEESSWER